MLKRKDIIEVVNKHCDAEKSWSHFHIQLSRHGFSQLDNFGSQIGHNNDKVTILQYFLSLKYDHKVLKTKKLV